jgi:transcription termination factor Rho
VSKEELEREHLARLHARAAELGVPRYRLLRRGELIDEIVARDGGEGREAPPGASRPPAEETAAPEVAETSVTGILDVLPSGHGFVRLKGLEDDPDDVYVSASQIRRCELRPGDHVEGPSRPPRRGERHPALVRVERVNGEEPGAQRPPGFDELTPVTPHRRIPLAAGTDDLLLRAADLLVPLAFGQRVLVVAEPRSGRTSLLRGLAAAIAAAPQSPSVIVLLIDERPEEVTEWKRRAGRAEIAAAPADLGAEDQVRHAELVLARAKRGVERGEDVVVIVDSLTRLGVAYRDPIAVKPVFGAGRELEEEGSGSLTMIATVLRGTEDGERVMEAVETTENASIVLDSELAGAGVVPAINVERTQAVGEDQVRGEPELGAVRRLREELRGVEPRSAAEALAERLRNSSSNAELLASL